MPRRGVFAEGFAAGFGLAAAVTPPVRVVRGSPGLWGWFASMNVVKVKDSGRPNGAFQRVQIHGPRELAHNCSFPGELQGVGGDVGERLGLVSSLSHFKSQMRSSAE